MRLAIQNSEISVSIKKNAAMIIVPLFLVLFAISCASSQVTGSDSEFQPTATAEQRAQAAELKRKAEQGDVEAQNDLCILYINGLIFKTNARAAAKWAHAAANQGSVKGQVNLGTFYLAGTGVALDYAQARHWLQKAADQGNPQAEFDLGVMYTRGDEGIKKNYEEALRLFLKSAEQGHVPAAYNVGLIYSKAIGVPKDEVKGYMWLLIAAHFGYVPSQKTLKILDAKMGSAKVAEARSRADEWVKEHPKVKPILY